MPAPGDQHRDTHATVNPFVDQKPHITEYTAQEIATLQSRLERQLGPEYISTRPGNGGGKVHYLAAEKVINLANEVFGFNGWSSSIQNVQIDFVDENPQTQKINLGLSTIVRVTLKDGTFHEDIGYGHCENTKGKAAAFEKAKKEAATDAMKRALRNFGNVLGNCLYDKDYLQKITKVKVAPSKWNTENLHRHPDFAPVKREPVDPNTSASIRAPAALQQTNSVNLVPANGSTDADDDFGANDFDETDFSHPDEVRLDDSTMDSIVPQPPPPRLVNGQQINVQHQGMQRMHSMPQMRPSGPLPPPLPPGVQAPPRPQAAPRLPINVGQPNRMLPPHTPGNQPKPQAPQAGHGQSEQVVDGVRSNSSSGSTIESPSGKPVASGLDVGPLARLEPVDEASTQPPARVAVGFVSGRAAAQPDANAAFNPHAESPSIRRTQGVNPGVSAPIKRTQLGSVPAYGQSVAPADAAGGNQITGGGNGFNGAGPRAMGSNYLNPAADMNRRIGMPPGGGFQANRGGYKPPSAVKRPAMTDVTNTHSTDGVNDAKKAKVDGRGGENGSSAEQIAGVT